MHGMRLRGVLGGLWGRLLLDLLLLCIWHGRLTLLRSTLRGRLGRVLHRVLRRMLWCRILLRGVLGGMVRGVSHRVMISRVGVR